MATENKEALGMANAMRNILHTAKKNLFLILAVVLLVTALGGVYSYLVKPVYTATQKLVYVGENDNSDSVVNDYNTMNIFVGTIIDFCDEEVVIDRANAYYINYENEKAKPGNENYSVEDFIDQLKAEAIDPDLSIEREDKEIVKRNISVVSEIEDKENLKYIFTIKYSDPNKQAAQDKVKILVYAINKESNDTEKITIGNVTYTQNKYFEGLTSHITDLGTEGVTSSVSKPRIIIVSFVLGVMLAALVVYVKYMLDNGIKTKEDLEKITGAPVFAYIDNKGEN